MAMLAAMLRTLRTGLVTFLAIAAAIASGAPAQAQTLRRMNVWDLQLGAPVGAQPPWEEFKGYGCGTNGGPIIKRITKFAEFAACAPDARGWYEVYFEYDDELEFIARAMDNPMEIDRWAGTADGGHPVMVSALFDKDGILKAIRILTDPRADFVAQDARLVIHGRESAYQYGAIIAPRFNLDSNRDCASLPLAEGETAVAGRSIKLRCQRLDPDRGRRVVLEVNYYRKPGQAGRDPGVPTRLTIGQFESSTRLEIYAIP